ncbi:MAG TPA: hypothetical protein VLT47_10955 [Anaeromyxobacteraceae bacterium]|nr:hypothetical protein [Anaeromyxobacteraceae bacterium]
MARYSKQLTLTMPDEVRAKLDALAIEDAARTGANPDRQRSLTVTLLVLDEYDRRHPKKSKK